MLISASLRRFELGAASQHSMQVGACDLGQGLLGPSVTRTAPGGSATFDGGANDRQTNQPSTVLRNKLGASPRLGCAECRRAWQWNIADTFAAVAEPRSALTVVPGMTHGDMIAKTA